MACYQKGMEEQLSHYLSDRLFSPCFYQNPRPIKKEIQRYLSTGINQAMGLL